MCRPSQSVTSRDPTHITSDWSQCPLAGNLDVGIRGDGPVEGDDCITVVVRERVSLCVLSPTVEQNVSHAQPPPSQLEAGL